MVWDCRSGDEVLNVKHRAAVAADQTMRHAIGNVSFAPDGSEVATVGTTDFAVIRWDLETGQRLSEISLDQGNLGTIVRYSPDSKSLLIGGEQEAMIFDLVLEHHQTLDVPQVVTAGWVSGNELLISNANGTLGIYDTQAQRFTRLFAKQNYAPMATRFIPLGKH